VNVLEKGIVKREIKYLKKHIETKCVKLKEEDEVECLKWNLKWKRI